MQTQLTELQLKFDNETTASAVELRNLEMSINLKIAENYSLVRTNETLLNENAGFKVLTEKQKEDLKFYIDMNSSRQVEFDEIKSQVGLLRLELEKAIFDAKAFKTVADEYKKLGNILICDFLLKPSLIFDASTKYCMHFF